MSRITTTILVTGMALAGALADRAGAETLGTIAATWDGQDRTWFITSRDGESQSTHKSLSKLGDVVGLWGNPGEDDLAATKDVLELTFTTMTGPQGKIGIGAEMRYLIQAYQDYWDASEEGQTKVTLTTYEKTDTALHIAGTFEARPAHAGETREVNGSFDVTFPTE